MQSDVTLKRSKIDFLNKILGYRWKPMKYKQNAGYEKQIYYFRKDPLYVTPPAKKFGNPDTMRAT